MVDRVRSVDFLPEIFQTPVNKQFLNATLDQLVQEPAFNKSQGFIGRRVGPGVNPKDRYVIEPDKTRTDYQLEPGVISLDPTNTQKIDAAITFPGMNDALKMQGAFTDDIDRLYVSDYYTFDPFIDLDKLINYSQYYWLPKGPLAVTVEAVQLPLEETFNVTRDALNNAYKFVGNNTLIAGKNPKLSLVRGGTYQFNIQQTPTTTDYLTVSVLGTNGYTIDGELNPTLTLVRGNTYVFSLVYNDFGVGTFFIKTQPSPGTTYTWDEGVTGQGGMSLSNEISFTVPLDAPNTLYYCDIKGGPNFLGEFNVVDPVTGTGPQFWIQANPGVQGGLSWSPNISARDVYGVTNNGIDFGTVTFNVPQNTAQSFYYGLTQISAVDLATNIPFADLNGITQTDFIRLYKNIDGINNLEGRTIVFLDQSYSDVYIMNYLPDAYGVLRLNIQLQTTVVPLDKFSIRFGDYYCNRSFYKNAFGTLEQVPLLTAIDDVVYYQDSEDPLMFGTLEIIPDIDSATLDIADILGHKNYLSPNGVVFTNGMLVTFKGPTIPSSYSGGYYYVEGVGTAIKLVDYNLLVTPEPSIINESLPFDPWWQTNPAWDPNIPHPNTNPIPEDPPQRDPVVSEYNGLLGSYDVGNFDSNINAPLLPEYITIARGSPDNNAWSRANRWFHIDTIKAAFTYNNTIPQLDNLQRGRRPIIEFRAGTKLFNYGTGYQLPVNIIDFETTNALRDIAGQPTYTYDQYTFIQNTRVIFANDVDPSIRQNIYQVQYITPNTGPDTADGQFTPGYTYQISDLGTTNWNAVAGTTGVTYEVGSEFTAVTAAGTIPPGSGTAMWIQPVIDLVQVGTMLVGDNVPVLDGAVEKGQVWYWDGVAYIQAQAKTSVNQAPMFDVYDKNGVSLADPIVYPSSTFRGSKLFSYALGTGAVDPILGFALSYYSLTNVADILFDNNLYSDKFTYVINKQGITTDVSMGVVRQYADRTTYVNELGWQRAATKSISRQQFRFTYDITPLQLDIIVDPDHTVPSVQLYVNSKFQDPSNYVVSTNQIGSTITLNAGVAVIDDIIEVLVISGQVSKQGFFTVPINLENNPLNVNNPGFTLGTLRTHYQTICENLIDLQGPVDGANNTRDLGNILPYGLEILQQSSPLTLAGYFMRNQEYDIFDALTYNSREYIKFKDKLLENVVSNDYGTMTIPQILDAAIADISLGKTDKNPFYWSDMLPHGSNYLNTTITITQISGTTFTTKQTYNFSSANYLGLLIYLNDVLLVKGVDYTVATDGPRVTIITPMVPGDVLVINEYNNTAGSFIPNTPSKMGLYPKYVPELIYDTTYVNPTYVIIGHDGSRTIAFPDYRTEILLEFEKRIYDNIKMEGNPVPLSTESVTPGFFTNSQIANEVAVLPSGLVHVLPGYFRGTDYTHAEITQILSEDFLAWVGWNKLDYKAQDYIPDNPFTWNYSDAGNKINEQPLLGAWRGIYYYFYDTDTPNTTPWEMLGFTEMPSWWESRYGVGPYTSGNAVLWDDLELGLVADPVAPYILPEYARPGLSKVIPSDDVGNLLAPDQAVMGYYDPGAFRKSWSVGDGGPVEASWWYSSSYPFAQMRLLVLTRPAEFFALFADRDLYKYNAEFGQYLYKDRYRLDANGVQVYGNGVSKASYINWIVDYNRQLGVDSTTILEEDLKNLDVRLCYRMAGFSDKQYLSLYCERSSPNNTNSSLQIPDQSYQLLLYKNQPFNNIVYSAMIVERVENGYQVFGYSNIQPYFTVQVSNPTGLEQQISAGGKTVTVPAQYTDNTAQFPYGTVFLNDTAVVDFILSYGKYLENQGLIYDTLENGYIMNWKQMASEFLYFAQQNWAPGTMINLNPSGLQLKATKPGAIVDTIASVTPENMLLDQNRVAIPVRDLNVERFGNTFSISPVNNQTISFCQLRFTSYEHMIVFDNTTVFQDLIYEPSTAARQSRLELVGYITSEWDGSLDAQGFILNQNNVEQWQPNKKYAKGEIVLYKNIYWSAQYIVQPSAQFNYNDWVKSEYSIIQRGLLPNIANKADQLANTYSVQVANLDADNDLFSYGLIGFRPREYMSSLNLDDSSQIQIYQQFLGSKGTTRAAELFTRANLGSYSGEYSIYENWAALIATYGAQANESFVEFRTNEALLQADPSTIQVIEPLQHSEANQTILLQDIWRSSYKLPSTDIFTTIYPTKSDTALPSAGYVNFDDVDINVFSLNDPSAIDKDLDSIGVGTVIWVAKVNSYDWGIYRCQSVPGFISQIADNLNDTSIATFTKVHNLNVGDLVIIKFFNKAVDGVYRVLSVPGITTIVIAYSFTNSDQTVLQGSGLGFYLQSMRVAQASDIYDLPYAQQLPPGARAWVDNDGKGHWVVLEKTDPFTHSELLQPRANTFSVNYGSSVAQASDNTAAVVGAPGVTGVDIGAISTYHRGSNNLYLFDSLLQLNTTDTVNFGASITVGRNNWIASGAPESYGGVGYVATIFKYSSDSGYSFSQLLLPPDLNRLLPLATNFGTTVTMSDDDNWLFVGAPTGVVNQFTQQTISSGKVYAYAKQNVQTQSVKYFGDGQTTEFNYSNSIIVNADPYPNQLLVTVNNGAQIFGVDWYVGVGPQEGNVVFTTPPLEGSIIIISRRTTALYGYNVYYNVTPTSTSGIGSGATFTVQNTRGAYQVVIDLGGSGYGIGDTLTIPGTSLGGTSPANDLTITVQATVYTAISEISFTGTGSGSAVTTFNLSDYLFTAININSFNVLVNNVLQRPLVDYSYNQSTHQFTFYVAPPVGSSVVANSGTYYMPVTTLKVEGLQSDAQFGASISTTSNGRQTVIGAPYADGYLPRSGCAYIFDRSVYQYIVTDPAQMTYAIPGQNYAPIVVIHNGKYLTNTFQSIGGQFTVIGSNVILSNITLEVGDVIEIETNDFVNLQKLQSNSAVDEAAYGASSVICSNNCSVLIGAPNDGTNLVQAGSVDRLVSQAQVYGVITSLNANPILTPGTNFRINNMEIDVPAAPNNTVAGLVDAINASIIPNVLATSTPDVILYGDSQTKVFYIGSMYTDAQSYNTVVYVNDILQSENINYTYNPTTEEIIFIGQAPIINSVIRVISGRLVLSCKNPQAVDAYDLLSVLPGTTGHAFNDLGFQLYVWTQNIVAPYITDYAHFGQSLALSPGAFNLVVGAPNGDIYEQVTFDSGNTYFDEHSTTFFTPIRNGGVVYSYDYLPSASDSIAEPGKFVFGQQIYNENTQPNDRYGTSISYETGKLLVGAPNATESFVEVFDNPHNVISWQPVRIQQPTVDVNLIQSVFMYNSLLSQTQTYFDFFDPLQGKILSAARRNIDYLGAVDPASYNVGAVHNNGTSWAVEHVGEIWWDTDTVRFIDPNQDDLVYASRRWGQTFPGSRVDIYQWVQSDVPPAEYTGPGIPLSVTSYTVKSYLSKENIFRTEYFFWARGITTIATGSGKTLSTTGIANYIQFPRTSGIPYVAFLNSSSVAMYNALPYFSAFDTILHIDYRRVASDSNVHTEYKLIADGKEDSFLNDGLYRKMLDSFCGVDTQGNDVPDPFLSPPERYGVQFRPRQSMFKDRYSALQNYLGHANKVMLHYPISETRSFALLNSSEPIPGAASGAWDKEVANIEILGYQDIYAVPLNYKYLVVTDSTNNGLWTIYQVVDSGLIGGRQLQLMRVQNYDTKQYWYYTNWYRLGYNSTIQPLAEVPVRSALDTLTLRQVPVGSSAKVTANSQGFWEIYLRTDTGWERVGLENGTIQLKTDLWDYSLGNFGFDAEVYDAQYYDQEPTTETRQIIKALNEQIYINDLLIERNRSLMIVFEYIYSEFEAPNWLLKTSLIDVNHKIATLEETPVYQQNSQTFVLDYIQEVKPYHVQIREFNLTYSASDTYAANFTDFDIPAYWNSSLPVPQYISPVLDFNGAVGLPYIHAETTVRSNISDTSPDAQIWQLEPWSDWFNNYGLGIQEITVVSSGQNYSQNATVVVFGHEIVPAIITPNIGPGGSIISVKIINPGQYIGEVSVVMEDSTGTGAILRPTQGNNLVRSIKTTIKYDRFQYHSDVVEWAPNTSYLNGTLVRYENQTFEAYNPNAAVVPGEASFDLTYFTTVPASELSGVNRTMGYYVAGPNMPGLSLPLLIDGVEYPGVQVKGQDYDVVPGNNINYDPTQLDAIYESEYLDIYLGTRPEDLNVDGGLYVDNFSTHAPEELVPGMEYDTLDFRVYTSPGGNYAEAGHGFPQVTKVYTFDPANPTINFKGLVPYVTVIQVTNLTNGQSLVEGVNYFVNWGTYTISFPATLKLLFDTQIAVTAYELGGGNQLFKNSYLQTQVTNNTIIIPVATPDIDQFAIFVNGQLFVDFTYDSVGLGLTSITFNGLPTSDYLITVNVLGPVVIDGIPYDYGWSDPITQIIRVDLPQPSYTLTNSLDYTNPVVAIVIVNGRRVTTAANNYYVQGLGTTTYEVPNRIGQPVSTIPDNTIIVYVDSILQTQGVEYTVDPYLLGAQSRTITFVTEPTPGSTILVCTICGTQAYIVGDQLYFNPVGGLVPTAGAVIEVITFNDTRQQNLVNQVWVGPVKATVLLEQGFDSTLYSTGMIDFYPGSYDFSAGILVNVNNFFLPQPVPNPSTLWVTLNGNRLFPGSGFTINQDTNELILVNGPINATDVVCCLSMTAGVVPEALAFRIFQDMRGLQATYRMTPTSTTWVTQDATSTDDIIYVEDINALSDPNLEKNIWGVVTINGERIMYRERDLVNKAIVGLMRGTAGTAAAPHLADSFVYDLGRGNLMYPTYQDYIVQTSVINEVLGKTSYTAPNIYEQYGNGAFLEQAVEVFVGGFRVMNDGQLTDKYSITSVNPVTVEFVVAPPIGVQVTILVRRGKSWYAPGSGTASNGIPLQEQTTMAALFFKGL